MNKSFYFQHDYNASNDFKILFLRQQLGIEAYGIYWYIIEQLAQSNGKMPLKIIPVIAMQIQTTADKVSAVVKNYDLFVIENEEFFSVRLLQNIGWREQKSIDGKSGALKRWGNKAKNSIPNSPANGKPIADKGDIGDKEDIVYPATLIKSDELYWENILMKYSRINPEFILSQWEAWYINKFEWRNKELRDMRLSYQSWLENPQTKKKSDKPRFTGLANHM